MGVEIKESPVTDAEFEAMKQFVRDYLTASVESEEEGGRMRWYPWHSATYRFNHIMNVVELAGEIARREGADVDVTRVAALFHDVAKLEAEQDRHAEVGAKVAKEYLTTHGDYPQSFVEQVVDAVRDHSYQGDLTDLPLETQCLIEADILDKVGANGATLLLLRMGYESRTHMDAAEMVGRVLERGRDARDRVRSDAAESVAHRRLKRVKWLKEWLEEEVTNMDEGGGFETDEPESAKR
ncbi:HD domain-containing protein [Halapricum desulfuricans]|uniref:Putative HD superfamily hydrolase n=1 Tax=Halapricum desulfuricans TaxID=2841257 RepID=A0A897MXF7_9EURY|nr:HD domain-containing protein [Halapricum desulfuricans]QSG04961.1 putative HD superfamily hydrolase [Halapricum desulfuricans]